MSKAWKTVLIVLAIVLALAVALHLLAWPMMSSLAQSMHGR